MAGGIQSDPQYLALLRALGFEENTLQANAALKVANAQSKANLNVAHIQQQGDVARQNIYGNMESRGLFSSGETLTRESQQRADEGWQTNAERLNAAMTGSEAQGQAGAATADLNRQMAEKMLDIGTQRDYRNQLATAQAQYGQ